MGSRGFENHRYIRATIALNCRRCDNKAEALIYWNDIEAGVHFKEARIAGPKCVIAQVFPESSAKTYALIGGIDE